MTSNSPPEQLTSLYSSLDLDSTVVQQGDWQLLQLWQILLVHGQDVGKCRLSILAVLWQRAFQRKVGGEAIWGGLDLARFSLCTLGPTLLEGGIWQIFTQKKKLGGVVTLAGDGCPPSGYWFHGFLALLGVSQALQSPPPWFEPPMNKFTFLKKKNT